MNKLVFLSILLLTPIQAEAVEHSGDWLVTNGLISTDEQLIAEKGIVGLDWHTEATYQTDDIVCVSGVIYTSLQDNNIGHAVTDGSWWAEYSSGGVTTFLGLTDTPGAYTADYYVKVNAGGTALELVVPPSGTTNLSNTPAASTIDIESSSGSNTTISAATTSLAGVMAGADKVNLDANTVHRSSTGADHTYLDQSVTSGSSPTFDGTNITNVLHDLVNDTTPQLGANLDIQTYSIEGVDSIEFGYVDGVTSDIQTQLNGKEGALVNSAGLASALSDETGTGASVFGTSPTVATPSLTGKITGNAVSVSDDDCTGEQGRWWFDDTDGAFEFCNDNSGAPAIVGASSPDPIAIMINGGGDTIALGLWGCVPVPSTGTITAYEILCTTSGNLEVDIWVDTRANYPPTSADSITATNYAAVSADDNSYVTTLTGWTTSLTEGDSICYNVVGTPSVENCTLTLWR